MKLRSTTFLGVAVVACHFFIMMKNDVDNINEVA